MIARSPPSFAKNASIAALAAEICVQRMAAQALGTRLAKDAAGSGKARRRRWAPRNKHSFGRCP